jgi:RNA polymerase sigma factor (sigma-70 family)
MRRALLGTRLQVHEAEKLPARAVTQGVAAAKSQRQRRWRRRVAGQPTGQEFPEIASDPDAFERFYRRHVEAVQRFVARRIDDPYLAADLTADAFVATIESASTYRRSRGEPVAWLFGITRNVIARERRRNAQELRATARVRGHELVDEDDLVALQERIDAESTARALYQKMTHLSAAERAVLNLVALDSLTVGDAARAIGIGPVAARVPPP